MWNTSEGSRDRRERMMKAAREISEEVGVYRACEALSVSRATYYRRLRPAEPVNEGPSKHFRALSAEGGLVGVFFGHYDKIDCSLNKQNGCPNWESHFYCFRLLTF